MWKKLSSTDAQKLVESKLKYILLDIDGVLWSGSHVFPKAPETLQYLREKGKQIRFLTNNASVSREQLVENFKKKGFDGVTVKEVCNSGYAAALRLQQALGEKREGDGEPLVHGNVFVVGEQGLCDEIQQVLAPGFITYGTELHDPEGAGGYDAQTLSKSWQEKTLPAPKQRLAICSGDTCRTVQAGTPTAERISLSDLNPVAVVAGLDKHFNILSLGCASVVLQGIPSALADHDGPSKPAIFIATNEDPQIPVGPQAVLAPGAGVMIQALSTVTGRKPDAVCGKPNTDMAHVLFEAEGIKNPKEECLMIGDRLTTDVAFGNNAGCQTMLVLTGAEKMEDVERAQEAKDAALLPQYIADSIAVFLPE